MGHALATLVVMVCAYPLTMSVITIWTAAMPATKPTALQPPSRTPSTLGSYPQGAPTPEVSLVHTCTQIAIDWHSLKSAIGIDFNGNCTCGWYMYFIAQNASLEFCVYFQVAKMGVFMLVTGGTYPSVNHHSLTKKINLR